MTSVVRNCYSRERVSESRLQYKCQLDNQWQFIRPPISLHEKHGYWHRNPHSSFPECADRDPHRGCPSIFGCSSPIIRCDPPGSSLCPRSSSSTLRCRGSF